MTHYLKSTACTASTTMPGTLGTAWKRVPELDYPKWSTRDERSGTKADERRRIPCLGDGTARGGTLRTRGRSGRRHGAGARHAWSDQGSIGKVHRQCHRRRGPSL